MIMTLKVSWGSLGSASAEAPGPNLHCILHQPEGPAAVSALVRHDTARRLSAMHDHLVAPRPVRLSSNPISPYANNISPIRSPVASFALVGDSFARLRLDGSPPSGEGDALDEDLPPRFSSASPRYALRSPCIEFSA